MQAGSHIYQAPEYCAVTSASSANQRPGQDVSDQSEAPVLPNVMREASH